MPPRVATRDDLLRTLERLGTASARELGGALGVSQQTISRLLTDASRDVLRFGKTKGARYARSRRVPGLEPAVPVVRISEQGGVTEAGTLHLLSGTRHWLERPGSPVLYEGLPAFIADMSPQGYLGRSFSERHPDLALPRRTQDWSSDHLLLAVCRRGEDTVGDLILGQESLDRHLASQLVVTPSDAYPARARESTMEDAGSSAGGERPKFLAWDGERHLLVKFAQAGDSPEALRWRDLLVCESLALEAIHSAGFASAQSRIVDVEGMRFLEVVRFDRIGARGRVGVMSLGAWDDGYLGLGGSWVETTERMRQQGALSDEEARAARWLDTFGALIANSDRHRGNLAFFADELDGTNLRLAPAYDMLPMHFAPRAVGVDAPPFVPPPPRAATRDVWMSAAEAAVQLWRRAAADPRISADFRGVAASCAQTLEAERDRVSVLLPPH